MTEAIETPRLRLHRWHDRHRDAFASMHADPEVMADLGGPIDRTESDRKLDRYRAAQHGLGIARWAVEDPDGAFLGYAGVMPRPGQDHPLGAHFEIGWRFVRSAWGLGYATESAEAALRHAIHDPRLKDIVAYTGRDNLRSQAIMTKLGLIRVPSCDFALSKPNGEAWEGLVWIVPLDAWRTPRGRGLGKSGRTAKGRPPDADEFASPRGPAFSGSAVRRNGRG